MKQKTVKALGAQTSWNKIHQDSVHGCHEIVTTIPSDVLQFDR